MTILSGAFPDSVSKEVRALLEEHIHYSNAASSSNNHTADEQKFAQTFTEDGIYEVAETQSVGPDAIIAFREKFFKDVPHRDHPVVKVFTYGPDDKNLMIYGNVGVELPEGTKHSKEWAGRYEIVDTGSGGLKFKYVQVFVTALQDA
ncbi:MAG: hypothetical protein GOMPHAMPRED_004235 [Gomphillus americanus]|uniref:Uncharacterized protein n=1 Tax=Gomphillus americanus TaxID=1940652 RepID=A0A8H3FS41_9LECA|nr:MAG: hypothetical protein GOMPHAMPRED_004235 [Gomphillus americanus]